MITTSLVNLEPRSLHLTHGSCFISCFEAVKHDDVFSVGWAVTTIELIVILLYTVWVHQRNQCENCIMCPVLYGGPVYT